MLHNRLIRMFQGREVEVSHTSPFMKTVRGTCRAIHIIHGQPGRFRIQIGAVQYGFDPEVITDDSVDGPSHAFFGGRRKIQVIHDQTDEEPAREESFSPRSDDTDPVLSVPLFDDPPRAQPEETFVGEGGTSGGAGAGGSWTEKEDTDTPPNQASEPESVTDETISSDEPSSAADTSDAESDSSSDSSSDSDSGSDDRE